MKKKMAIAALACLLLTGCGMDTMADSLAGDIAGQLESLYGQTSTQEWQPNPETEPMQIQVPESTKTDENPVIELRNKNDLELLRENPAGNFILACDISIDGTFTPIEEFSGMLDGQGHWIRNLTLKMTGQETYGLFRMLESGSQVRNLGLEIVATVTEYMPTYVMGIAWSNAGIIVNCSIRSDIAGGTEYYPVACVNDGTIENCDVATEARNTERVYGLVGENNGNMHDCQVELNVESCSVLTGLTYRNWADIADCEVTAKGKSILEFDCVSTQNYAKITGCTFNAQLTPPDGETLDWYTSWYSGEGGDFDSSNTVNVQESN